MREIGTPNIGSHITNLHIKRPRITVNKRIGSRKRPFLNRIFAIADKKIKITRAACILLELHKLRKIRLCKQSFFVSTF